MKAFLSLLLALLLPCALAATPQFDDPAQESRYYHLTRIIRCPTCQNQNIAESDAPLARQLRQQIEAQIKQGRDDSDISAYLVERYGDFITYAPPFAARTWLLWLAPFAIMTASLAWWFIRRKPAQGKRLNAREQHELHTLLDRHRKQP
ncbi:MAG: cytochrome c-type biogenesis protein CcmH [Cardiobacteriaceae bacterium]|nr:cytochrome c-type biogenesis protein CcmH [Cardiobacteriaceae bacterium]